MEGIDPIPQNTRIVCQSLQHFILRRRCGKYHIALFLLMQYVGDGGLFAVEPASLFGDRRNPQIVLQFFYGKGKGSGGRSPVKVKGRVIKKNSFLSSNSCN